MDGVWVPIVLFLTLGVVVGISLYFRFRTRREIQLTVRQALESGQTLTADMLQSLADSLTSRHADLRRGVISIALGLALLGFAGLLGEPDAEGPLRAVALFPLLVGIAYLGMWYFLNRGKK